jgi:hypothetical protein
MAEAARATVKTWRVLKDTLKVGNASRFYGELIPEADTWSGPVRASYERAKYIEPTYVSQDEFDAETKKYKDRETPEKKATKSKKKRVVKKKGTSSGERPSDKRQRQSSGEAPEDGRSGEGSEVLQEVQV